MPAVPVWTDRFDLTNPYSGTLTFNVQTADGLFLLDQDACDFQIGVRATKFHVPQADGDILPDRFLSGTEMPLTIQLWEQERQPACGEVLVAMLDLLSGSLRSLLNAGDNEGRLAWEIAGGATRMLDDLRLFVYPSFKAGSGVNPIVTVTVDSKYPYAQDLTQTRTGIADAATVTITNGGNADYFPVFQVNRLNGATSGTPVSSFLLENLTTGQQIDWDASQPGGSVIPGGSYGEISTFDNTFYLNGDSSNEQAGILQLDTEYFVLVPGANDITINGCATDVLHQAAWG